jgi:hypothetical protein
MLIEFSVGNFRSFRDAQTLSMVAAPRLRRRQNIFEPMTAGEKMPALLKVAVIYGPNASGKSNLLKALDCVRQIASREPSTADTPLDVAPFKFDPKLKAEPSTFDVHFIQDGTRFHFELAATTQRIVFEKLTAFPKGREQTLYTRTYTRDGEKYDFGEDLEGGRELAETWRKLTPPGLLFIAQAAANSNEELSQLKRPFNWIKGGVRPLLSGLGRFVRASQELAKGAVHATEIAGFLRAVDVPISKIRVDSLVPQDSSSASDEHPFKAPVDMTLTHESALGEAEMNFVDESEGTKNLIGFWLPWVIKEYKNNPSRVLIIDEMDSSLHPIIVAALVEKHLNADPASQLIFTTHDTHLMDAKLLRRDQIWVTERDMNAATQLRCVHDFEGREGEDIEKRYFEGRYRGLPLLKRS